MWNKCINHEGGGQVSHLKSECSNATSALHWKEMLAWCSPTCLSLSGTHLTRCPVQLLGGHGIWPLICQERHEREEALKRTMKVMVKQKPSQGDKWRRSCGLGRSDPRICQGCGIFKASCSSSCTPLCSQLGWRRARKSEQILPTVVDPTWENYKFSNMGVHSIVKSNKTASSHRLQHNILFIPPSPFPVTSKNILVWYMCFRYSSSLWA